MTQEVMDDGTGHRQGRTGQEGQPQEGSRKEGSVRLFRTTPIFDELSTGMEHLLSEPNPDPDQGKFRQQGWGQDLPSNRPILRCQICQLPEYEHSGKHHAFSPPGTPVDTAQFARRRPGLADPGDVRAVTYETPRGDAGASRGAVMTGPFDPVLRQALVDKGIITPEDLQAAAAKIAAMTATIGGQVTRDARTRSSSVRSDAPE